MPSRVSVRGLRTAPLGMVRVAVVGVGERGLTALRLLSLLGEARVTVVADVRREAVEAAAAVLPAAAAPRLLWGEDAAMAACREAGADLVYVCSDWRSHAAIGAEAMARGKHVALEVPAATTLDDLHLLVAAAETSRRHCFLLENCCYDPDVEQAVQAVRRGDIGQPVHADGAYYHCLADRWTPWRLEMNRLRRGDLYPTHELGPICQMLDINRSDSLQTLVCMDSASFTGSRLCAERGLPADDFQNGDHTTTLIRTTRGCTILLRHDVMTPQPYDRSIHVVGTRGDLRTSMDGSPQPPACASLRSGHEAMTFEMNRRLVHQLAHGLPLDFDVYDLATWCAVVPLSHQSASQGFVPVAFPRFGV